LGGTVHVIDDDDALRESLVAGLTTRGFSARGWGSARAFLVDLEDLPPGCVVTDVQMPEMTGLELLHRLDGRPEFPVIVLTGEADVPLAVEALKAGALDLLQKPCNLDALTAAVNLGLAELNARFAPPGDPRATAAIAALSPRERDVLERIVVGQSNKEVARDLDLSPRTVEAYRAKLMVKLGVRSLVDLVRLTVAANGQT